MKKFISLLLVTLLLCTGFMLSGCAAKGPELEQLKKDLKAAGYYDNMLPDSIKAIEKDMYARALALTGVKTVKSEKADGGAVVYSCKLTFENEILYIEGDYSITYTNEAVTAVNRMNTDRFVRLTVPAVIEEVDSFTYQNNTDIDELVVEDGVSGIGESAFAGCTSLKKVTIGGDLIMLATAVFKDCTALESVTCTGENPLAILKESFSGCTSLKEITFSSALEFVGSYAFAGTAFTSLVFPDGVYEFGAGCFSNCKKLKSVNITPKMTTINSTAFEGCDALSKLTVSPKNTNFKMDGKNLVEIASGSVVCTLK